MMGSGTHWQRRPSTRAARRGESGFTMIEAMIAVIIIVVLACLAVPMLRDVTAAFRFRGAVASVTGAIQSTRYQAIYQGYSYQVVFDAAAKTYQVQSKPIGAAGFTNVGTAILWSESAQRTTLNANTTLTFSPGGKVTGAGGACPCTLTLSYPNKTPEVITVSAYGNINVTP